MHSKRHIKISMVLMLMQELVKININMLLVLQAVNGEKEFMIIILMNRYGQEN